MFIALNEKGERVYAENAIKNETYFCQYCEERLIVKQGKHKRAHFAHRDNSDCRYDSNNGMSEWHIHMQEKFPVECREILFKDSDTKERHIADIFVKEANTVIEFQHSRINDDEFISRTAFHLGEGRRIAWVFDESNTNKSKSENEFGKIKRSRYIPTINGKPFIDTISEFIKKDLEIANGGNSANFSKEWNIAFQMVSYYYNNLGFKWNYRRKVLKSIHEYFYNPFFCIFIFTGVEGDVIHRIIAEDNDFEHITLSIRNFMLDSNLKVEDMFLSEESWLKTIDWIQQIENRKTWKMKEIEDFNRRAETQPNNIKKRPITRNWHF